MTTRIDLEIAFAFAEDERNDVGRQLSAVEHEAVERRERGEPIGDIAPRMGELHARYNVLTRKMIELREALVAMPEDDARSDTGEYTARIPVIDTGEERTLDDVARRWLS